MNLSIDERRILDAYRKSVQEAFVAGAVGLTIKFESTQGHQRTIHEMIYPLEQPCNQ